MTTPPSRIAFTLAKLGVGLVVGTWCAALTFIAIFAVWACRPSVVSLGSTDGVGYVATTLGILGAAIVSRAPDGPSSVRRASVLVGVSSLLALGASFVELFRAVGVCERVGHWAPEHVHDGLPAGDVGESTVRLLRVGLSAVSVVLAIGGFLSGGLWRWCRRRATARIAGVSA